MTKNECREIARRLLEIEGLSDVMKASAQHASSGLLSAMRSSVREGDPIAAANAEGRLRGLEDAYLTLKGFANSKEEYAT